MRVPYVEIAKQFEDIDSDVVNAITNVLASGKYILGEQVALFERQFAHLCGVKHAIGVANGTDALVIAMKALGIGEGDEVITPANSWVSSTSSIALAGATPVFADISADLNMAPEAIERVITNKTKAIMPVHLTGKIADMKAVTAIAEKHGLYVIEDAAQSVGASLGSKKSGSLGTVACFSLHPLKNLNAAGDAGVITTDDDELAHKINLLRQHGLVSRNEISCWGYNSRLDEIQAAILNCKFAGLENILKLRQQNADTYRKLLADIVETPKLEAGKKDANHLFVIQCQHRDELKAYLKEKGISSAIHYPVPIHLQPAAEYLGYQRGDLPMTEACAERILSLPVHQHLSSEQLHYVADCIHQFYRNKDEQANA